MVSNTINGQSATVQWPVLVLDQYVKPLASGVGSTDVFAMDNAIAGNSATVKRDVLIMRQYPEPLASNIGREDLPGGFRKSSVMTGQGTPLGDLAHGVVQVDGVKVMFDVRA